MLRNQPLLRAMNFLPPLCWWSVAACFVDGTVQSASPGKRRVIPKGPLFLLCPTHRHSMYTHTYLLIRGKKRDSIELGPDLEPPVFPCRSIPMFLGALWSDDHELAFHHIRALKPAGRLNNLGLKA